MTHPVPNEAARAARPWKKRLALTLGVIGAVALLGAGLYAGLRRPGSDARRKPAWRPPSDAQVERDEIYMLLAYAVAARDWQVEGPDKRGFNVAAVLVDPSGTNAVFWAHNCNVILQNATQHAELRLMLGFLDVVRTYNLQGYTVYVTLEPCAQCAGMMTMTGVRRVVYGQRDAEYGRAFERLQLDTRAHPGRLRGGWKGSYPPYPRAVRVHRSATDYGTRLEEAYKRSKQDLPDFLYGETAKAIFDEARRALDEYRVRHLENQSVLSSARKLLEQVPADFVPLGLRI